MRWANQKRGWRLAGLCGLVWLAMTGLAVAQSDASTAPKKAPPDAPHTTAKAKHSTTAHATTKPTSTHRRGAAHSTQKSASAGGKKGAKRVARKRGQQAIDSGRAREIQEALIREHYLEGEPSGTWDSATQAAMGRYQADQGWQTKTTPDARALIKLGLGPSQDHLLNPESAMTAPIASDPKTTARQNPAGDGTPHR